MVEVIQVHLFKNGYPFGLQSEGQTTFVQVFRPNLSQEQMQEYKKNLQIFKNLKCKHILALDKFVKQDDSLHIYYKYQSKSLVSHLKSLSKISRSQHIHQICSNVVNQINQAIQCIIKCLTSCRIMADLSLQNMVVCQNLKIKMFIEPQIEVLFQQQNKFNSSAVLKDYYETQKKKLHIQFQQQLQHTFGKKKENYQTIKSPNFIIQGTKLVFIKQNQQKKNQEQKNFKSEKFDINNILDKNKMQKSKEQPKREEITQQKKQKKIQNYFNDEVNDNYTKDASFYPQQFTKQDTFADIQTLCYQQQLEKQLQQIKKKEKQKKQKILQQQKHNRESFDVNIEKQKPKLAHSNQIISKKEKNFIGNHTEGSIKSSKFSNNSKQYTLDSNQNSRDNSNNNSHNDSYNSQRQKSKNTDNIILREQKQKPYQNKQESSAQQNKKKKYKMKIITSHEVEIEDDGNQNFNIKDIEKEIVNDIKKGSSVSSANIKVQENKYQNKQNFTKNYMSNSNHSNASISQTLSSCKNIQTAQQKIKVSQRPGTSKAIQQKIEHVNHPFSKMHHIPIQNNQITQNSYLNQLKANFNQKYEKSQNKQDIKKLIQKIGIKQSKKNEDLINARQTICGQIHHKKQEERPVSNQNNQQEQEYINKIQKARSKAEQIMKMVNARKHLQHNQE